MQYVKAKIKAKLIKIYVLLNFDKNTCQFFYIQSNFTHQNAYWSDCLSQSRGAMPVSCTNIRENTLTDE